MSLYPIAPIYPIRPFLEENFQSYWTSSEVGQPWQVEREAKIMECRRAVSTPSDLMRRGIEMRRLKDALDRMPHPSWGEAPPMSRSGIRPRTDLRYVGTYVIVELTADECAHLSREMILADGERGNPSDWHNSLANFGMSAGCGGGGKPTREKMRVLVEDLAEFRTNERCTSGEWGSLIDGLCRTRDDEPRIRGLFEQASGITDEMLWGLKESAQAHEKARAAIEALNLRREELYTAGTDAPRAHINWRLFHPVEAPET
ncbi:hypothetical protein [Methylobacterium sp. J-090]|uniref:hypothetical protein n=1 Tax=Methylobacterium sp. J-090 TaxID=2836666 RepID=UPI001FB9FC71|nr:hypothetical protein [Methylobacterium sp. J-090]MCJ2084195.1 hypothetical protein [Methylobacterium sp. J-090]